MRLYNVFLIISTIFFSPFIGGNSFLKNPKNIGCSSLNIDNNYEGTIGNKMDVVFSLKENKGKISGFYFYQKIGIEIELKGFLKNDILTLNEINPSGKVTAEITAKINANRISGKWQNLRSKKSWNLELKQTDKKIPEIPNNLVGQYKNDTETQCKVKLDISKKNGAYFYNLMVEKKYLKGKITFYRSPDEQNIYITFEGIEYAENSGPLDENMEPDPDYDYLPAGIQGILNENKIDIQNSGNAMNSYTKFAECDDKFISLAKIK